MTPDTLAELRAGGAGPYDPSIVRKLRDWEVPATIFMTGLWAKGYPDEARDLAEDELFELANHSNGHAAWTADCYGLPSISTEEEKRAEVERAARSIERVAGESTRWFRFPGLCHAATDTELVASLGHQVVDGDVISGDAFNSDPAAIAQTVVDGVRPGSIVVLHVTGAPTAPATSEALDTIVPELRRRGYEFATLSELMAE